MNWQIHYVVTDNDNDVQLVVHPTTTFDNSKWRWTLYDIAEDGYCIAMSSIPGTDADEVKKAATDAYNAWVKHFKSTGDREMPRHYDYR